jgi:hypothetical protein
VSELAFLSVDDASRAASPLARSLRGAEGIGDLSLLGKLEVRGDIDAIEGDVIRITSERALVVCDLDDVAALRTALRGTVVDVTSALAGIEVEGEPLMRRVTDLALDRLPAAGKVADVPAVVTRQDERFRIFFPQEFGDSVVATVRDAQEGLR